MDTTSWSAEQIAKWAVIADVEQISHLCSQFSKDQILTLIMVLSEETSSEWREKTRAVVEGLAEKNQLEVVGSALSVDQALDLLGHYPKWEDRHRIKLIALLVGMANKTFIETLYKANQGHIQVLKLESMTEPVQHHLIMLSHLAAKQFEALDEEIIQLEKQIALINPLKMNSSDKETIENSIHALREKYKPIEISVDKGLGIAWNTGKLDLIDSLSTIKERLQRLILLTLGQPKHGNDEATGLYHELDKNLFSIYGNPANASDVQALHDEDPAIEGLARIGVWYLEDYFNLGLLPSDQKITEAQLKDLSENERAEYRAKLFKEAEITLKRFGLTTVKDLKSAFIFSRQTLGEYLGKTKGR